MARNLITEFKAFHEWLELNSLTEGQVALWHALLYVNNKCSWQDWFTVPSKTLELHSGLSRQSVIKARNTLKQKRLIDFQTQKGNKATLYRLFSLAFQIGTQTDTQTDTQADTQTDTINIQDIDRDIIIPAVVSINNIYNSDLEIVTAAVEKEICQVSSSIKDDIEFYLQSVDVDLILYAVDEATKSNCHKWKYVSAIIKRCIADKILTGAEARRRKEEYEKTKKSGKDGKFNDYSLKTSYDYDEIENRALMLGRSEGK